MRVAVRHTDKKHPNHGWFAVAEGRILGFTHPVTGENWTPEQVADALLARAKEQFPEDEGYEHRVETLHIKGHDEDGNELGEWHPVGKSRLPRAGAGNVTAEHTLEAPQGQEASQE